MSSFATVPRRRSIDASPALTRALAIFVALHAGAHVAGTGESFTEASDGGSVDYLAGASTIADPTVLGVLGVLWAFLGAVALVSLAVVVVAVWSSTVGVAIDVVLLAVAVRAGALPHPEATT